VPVARARFTGRAAVLVLVVAVLMVSYASSLRAYLEQKKQLDSLQSDISASQARIKTLSSERARWGDPAYVRAMAHQHFGWVLPGEIGYQVIGLNGKPLDPSDTLPTTAGTAALPTQWWQAAWGSVKTAGNPPSQQAQPTPATRINPPKH
jgi:cell division protein FtsB